MDCMPLHAEQDANVGYDSFALDLKDCSASSFNQTRKVTLGFFNPGLDQGPDPN
jgi:hypothetical protein